MLDTTWVEIPEGSSVAGRTLRDVDVRARSGASVVAVMRAGDSAVEPNPDGQYVFRPGDMVAVMGGSEQVQSFGELIAPKSEEAREPGTVEMHGKRAEETR